MQDRYEIPVNTKHPDKFPILDGCTFDMKAQDKCFDQWLNDPYVLAQRGAYATDGLAAAMAQVSTTAPTDDIDLFIFGGPINFRGYFPWSAHTRNKAGTVELRSTDPLEQPEINFNYFDTGTTEDGANQKDLQSLIGAIKISRGALSHFNDFDLVLPTSNFIEQYPGPRADTDEELGTYIKQVLGAIMHAVLRQLELTVTRWRCWTWSSRFAEWKA
ncbi:uncharacterized protein LTR77_008027 [Saxophila tyrrhenica]|uniref:Uncharacterized protein n=1 Tax=Saxophila tyrrhenica TaxID=1690608 RepID=A0AAV9P5J5_9PEZI|nr:hypothetical protein LTR77_008027 [Saxophila tyrrhenica]